MNTEDERKAFEEWFFSMEEDERPDETDSWMVWQAVRAAAPQQRVGDTDTGSTFPVLVFGYETPYGVAYGVSLDGKDYQHPHHWTNSFAQEVADAVQGDNITRHWFLKIMSEGQYSKDLEAFI